MTTPNPLIAQLQAQLPASTDPDRLRREIALLEANDKMDLEIPAFLRREKK